MQLNMEALLKCRRLRMEKVNKAKTYGVKKVNQAKCRKQQSLISKKQDIQSLKQELKEKDRENNSLRRSLASCDFEAIESLRNECFRLQCQNTKLVAANKRLTSLKAESSKRINEMA